MNEIQLDDLTNQRLRAALDDAEAYIVALEARLSTSAVYAAMKEAGR